MEEKDLMTKQLKYFLPNVEDLRKSTLTNSFKQEG